MDINILKDINKVLLFIEDLSKNSSFPSRTDILHAASGISYGDKKGHDDTLHFLLDYEFLELDNNRYRVSRIGKAFLSINKNLFIETSDKQKEYLLNLFLMRKPFKDFIPELLKNYDLSKQSNQLLIDPYNLNYNAEQIKLLHILRWLNLFKIKQGLYTCSTKSVKKIIQKIKKLSLSQLLEILTNQQQYSQKAEKLAEDFEKNRLLSLGMNKQSELVRLVSEENVLLGYDLISFNNENSPLIHDRFIEVKCSASGKVKFFWTINEMNKAKEIGKNYWIYFYSNILSVKNNEPLLINDPINTLSSEKFSILPTEFVIEEY